MLTENMLRSLWPRGDSKIPGLVAAMAASAPTVFPKWGVTNDLMIAHAMAQFSHECGAGTEVVENLNYRAEQLLKQWPTHFTHAQAIAMQHQPRHIADQAYNGRMGNRLGTDDGWNCRGRGPAQTTGRDEYARLGEALGLPLADHPDMINEPAHFLECGVANLSIRGCIPYMAKDNIIAVSGLLNVGHIVPASKIIGYSSRVHWLSLWKHVLGC
ncbi:glycoside hydrolase family 19 protein [Bradyrhizobium sp. RT10b]|uniref:glycoside hydrolase family 19 protein n=1 Tax=Bradyrhizobium sp. RT10b TaxID=3156331 RepID=UPI0033989947